MPEREILASRPHVPGAVTRAKLLLNAIAGRLRFTDGENFGADFEDELRKGQEAFGLEHADGKLDRTTLDVIAWAHATTPRPDPLVHQPTGAIIPTASGRTSLEVHLGTVGPGSELDRHLCHPSVPPEHRPAVYHTAYASTPWHRGAFGDLTPAEEQYYFDMRFPYSSSADDGRRGPGKSAYRGRRARVTNLRTGKACICTPGDWGPARSTGHVAGISPDTMHSTGGQHSDVYSFAWVDDATRLGPV